MRVGEWRHVDSTEKGTWLSYVPAQEEIPRRVHSTGDLKVFEEKKSFTPA
jgi:hypothetical protein